MTCENFILLCERDYYRGLPLHRIIKNFMLQAQRTGTHTHTHTHARVRAHAHAHALHVARSAHARRAT